MGDTINTLFDLPHRIDEDPVVFGDINGAFLAAPMSFWDASESLREEIVNGCGPGGLGDFLIPDTVWGLSIKDACKIHDWCFVIFNDDAGFKLSNQIFLDNMERINRARSRWGWLRWLRSMRIRKYYRAVSDFGRLFFYDAHVGLYGEGSIVYAGAG